MASEAIKRCSENIAAKGLKIAFAESATAGWMASEFSLTQYSGKILLGGIVCYDACTKEELFGIAKDVIEKYTPESAEVTKLLAERLSKFFSADISVAVTGLTTSGGSESDEKPVGTMFVYIIGPARSYCAHREVFEGTPEQIIKQTINRTGLLISDMLAKL